MSNNNLMAPLSDSERAAMVSQSFTLASDAHASTDATNMTLSHMALLMENDSSGMALLAHTPHTTFVPHTSTPLPSTMVHLTGYERPSSTTAMYSIAPARPLVPLAPAPPVVVAYGIDPSSVVAAASDASTSANVHAIANDHSHNGTTTTYDTDDSHSNSSRTKRQYRVLTAEQRDLAHRMLRQGFSKADAARVLDVNRRTLGESLKKFETVQRGGVPPRSQGRPPVITGDALAMVYEWADVRGVKALSELKTQLQTTHGINASLTTIRRVLLECVRSREEAALTARATVSAEAAVQTMSVLLGETATSASSSSSSSLFFAPTATSEEQNELTAPVDRLSHVEQAPALELSLASSNATLLAPQPVLASSVPQLVPAPVSMPSAPSSTVHSMRSGASASTATNAVASPTDTPSKRRYHVLTPAERDFAHRMVLKGFCKADAARVLDVNRSTLGASLKKLVAQQQGSSDSSAPSRSQGRPPVLTGAALAMVHEWADVRGAKALNDLKAQLQASFGTNVSLTTIRRVLLERERSRWETAQRDAAG